MRDDRTLAVAIDSSSDLAGVALVDDGVLLVETTWRTHQNHSKELLPTVEWALARAQRSKSDIGALLVCTGPGSYAGLRVGISTAKALAYGLEASLVAVNRLEADAEPLALATGRRVVSIQAAGRAELAWAAYRAGEEGLHELSPPGLASLEALVETLSKDDIVCAELNSLSEAAIEALGRAATLVAAPVPRVGAIARLGLARWAAGALENPDSLAPLYLRAPSIGPTNNR